MKGTLASILFAITLCPATFAAQTTMATGNLHRTVAPTHGVYNMTTGFEVSAQNYRSGPATIFDNTGGISYYFSTIGGTEEWIDSMAFANDELSGQEQINGFYFEYCSILFDPVGDAITTEVRFYNDNPGGGEPTGWTDLASGTLQNSNCAYAIAGLPGDTTSIGGGPCWAIAIDLACGFECTVDQELTPGGFTEFNGIGWMYMDALASGLTGPFLGSTITTAGPSTAVPGYGSQDLFELMDLAGAGGSAHQGTFWFGGAAKSQATFNVVMYGDGITDTDVVNSSAPDVGDVLCFEIDGEMRPNATVTWSLTDLGVPFANPTYAMMVDTNLSSLSVGGSTVMALNGLAGPLPMATGVSGTPSLTTTLPASVPATVYTQALGFSGAAGPGTLVEASNALRHNN